MWQLAGKRALADELLAMAGLSRDVKIAKLSQVTLDPSAVDWGSMFDAADEVDLVMIHGTTWRGNWAERVRQHVERRGAKLRVVLPDPDRRDLMEAIASATGETAPFLAERIRDALRFFTEVVTTAHAHGNQAEIRLLTCVPFCSVIRLGAQAVLCFYSYSGRSGLPHLVCSRGGALYEFARCQVEGLLGDDHRTHLLTPPERHNALN